MMTFKELFVPVEHLRGSELLCSKILSDYYEF